MTAAPRHRLLHALAVLVAAWCLFMILAGAMVTSMGAGDSVPDWPLSYGSLLPPMIGNIFWEHGHRLIGMALGLLVIGFTILVLRTDSRRWVRRLAVIGLIGVCLQGALGGLRVRIVSSTAIQHLLFNEPTGAQIAELRTAVAIVHTALAQSILGLFAVMVAATSPSWLRVSATGSEFAVEPPFSSPNARRIRVLATVTLVMVFVQILLGAVRRQTHTTIIPHAIGAGLVVLHVILLVRRILADAPQVAALVRPALILLLCAAGQAGLGVASWLITEAPRAAGSALPQLGGSTTLAGVVLSSHMALGAFTLAVTVAVAARSRHHVVAGRGPLVQSMGPSPRMVTA